MPLRTVASKATVYPVPPDWHVDGACRGNRTHTVRVLSALSLPLDYTRKCSCVTIRWQFAHKTTHFAISSYNFFSDEQFHNWETVNPFSSGFMW
jgi:hypothetical protein